MGNLFRVEVQTNRGKRYQVGEVCEEKEARGLFLVTLDKAKRGEAIANVSPRAQDSVYLVNVDANGNRVTDVEKRFKAWKWGATPLLARSAA